MKLNIMLVYAIEPSPRAEARLAYVDALCSRLRVLIRLQRPRLSANRAAPSQERSEAA